MEIYPYEKPVEPETVGMHPGKLARVVERFRSQQAAGAFPGGQLVMRRHGKLVLNEVVGIARGLRPGEPIPAFQVQPQTPFPLLSAGKPLAATAIAMLEERGALDVQAPIADVFPEFARNGKDRITTQDVLTHRSGVALPVLVKNTHLWDRREAIQQALIEAVPSYPRGTLAYLPHEYGWILDEIVLRVEGRRIAGFFAEEIAAPLGLPALQFGLAGRDINSLAFSYWLGKQELIIAGTNVAEDFEWQNTEPFFNVRNPATSLISDAASLASFYAFLLEGGKTPEGKQLISEETIRQYTQRHVLSLERNLKIPVALGRGFFLGTLFPSNFGWWNTGRCFGHAGGFSSLGFADQETGVAAAIVTNGNRSAIDQAWRFTPLAHGLRKASTR